MKNAREALDHFKKTGIFSLENASLNYKYIQTIQSLIGRSHSRFITVPPEQFYLSRVKILGPEEEIKPDYVKVGAITEHEVNYTDKLVDLTLVNMCRYLPSYSKLGYRETQKESVCEELSSDEELSDEEKAEDALLMLLTSREDSWSVIQCDHVMEENGDYLGESFQQRLFDHLKKTNWLKTFSLKPLVKSQQYNFLQFLQKNTKLKKLGFEINYFDSDFWMRFSKILSRRPHLEYLDLGDSILNTDAHNVLAHLLNKNYLDRIQSTDLEEEGLPTTAPTKQALNSPYLRMV